MINRDTYRLLKSRVTAKLLKTPGVKGVLKSTWGGFALTLPNNCSVLGSTPSVLPMMVPVLRTSWLVLKSALSRKTSWYSWVRLRGRWGSCMREKCRVLTPRVDASVPELLAGSSSARRKPVWTLSALGAKMEASLMVTSRGTVFLSNWSLLVCTCMPNIGRRERHTREPATAGSWRSSLNLRPGSVRRISL